MSLLASSLDGFKLELVKESLKLKIACRLVMNTSRQVQSPERLDL